MLTIKTKVGIKLLDQRLMYHVVIGNEVIHKGKCYIQKDLKYNDLSMETKIYSNGYTGCGLHDFDKKGE